MASISKILTRKQAHINEQRRIVQKKYNALFVAVGRRDGFHCQHCSSPTKDLQIDHVVPVSAGGGSGMENLQLLCQRCNASKGAKVPAVHTAPPPPVVPQQAPVGYFDYSPVRRRYDELHLIKQVANTLLWVFTAGSSELVFIAYYIHSGASRDLNIRNAAWLATGAFILCFFWIFAQLFRLAVCLIIKRLYGPPQHEVYQCVINDFIKILNNASLKQNTAELMQLSEVCLVLLCAQDQKVLPQLRNGMVAWAEQTLKMVSADE